MNEYLLSLAGGSIAIAAASLAAIVIGLPLWKGMTIGAAAAVAAFLANIATGFAPGLDASLAVPIAALLGAGVTGAALGVGATQTAYILIAAAVLPLLGRAILSI